MKEIGNDNLNLNKRLYYKKVAAILILAFFVFFGLSLISSLRNIYEDGLTDNIHSNEKTCNKKIFDWNELIVSSQKKTHCEEDDLKMVFVRELEDLQEAEENGLIIREFFDL